MSKLQASPSYFYRSATGTFSRVPGFSRFGTPPPMSGTFLWATLKSTLNSVDSATGVWGNCYLEGPGLGISSQVLIEDGMATSDIYRVDYDRFIAFNATDQEQDLWIGERGYSTDGRYNLWRHDDCDLAIYYQDCPVVWGSPTRFGRCTLPSSTEATYRINTGFRPEWIWFFGAFGTVAIYQSPYYSNAGLYAESFCGRDGSIESWSHWDEDAQTVMDSGTNYSRTDPIHVYYNGASYLAITGITWEDWGVTLNYSTSPGSYRMMNWIAGSNPNYAIGNAAGNAANTRVDLPFKPQAVFVYGGNRTVPGHSSRWQAFRGVSTPSSQMGLGFASRDGVSTSEVWRANQTAKAIGMPYYYTASFDLEGTVDLDESGFDINITNIAFATVSYLALGDPPPALVQPYTPQILA